VAHRVAFLAQPWFTLGGDKASAVGVLVLEMLSIIGVGGLGFTMPLAWEIVPSWTTSDDRKAPHPAPGLLERPT
jgi:hypothetical protein